MSLLSQELVNRRLLGGGEGQFDIYRQKLCHTSLVCALIFDLPIMVSWSTSAPLSSREVQCLAESVNLGPPMFTFVCAAQTWPYPPGLNHPWSKWGLSSPDWEVTLCLVWCVCLGDVAGWKGLWEHLVVLGEAKRRFWTSWELKWESFWGTEKGQKIYWALLKGTWKVLAGPGALTHIIIGWRKGRFGSKQENRWPGLEMESFQTRGRYFFCAVGSCSIQWDL